MNIILLGGFLGSGKTTFLKQLAGYLVSRQQRTVIIENEAGEPSVTDVDALHPLTAGVSATWSTATWLVDEPKSFVTTT